MSTAGYSVRSAEPTEASGAILRVTRAALVVQLVLAVANGLYLYVIPSSAATDYAWSIRPPINAAFMGAGYLAGMTSGILAVFLAKRWSSVRILIWPFAVLSLVMLAATLIHRERFFWDYPPTWIWTIVYAGIPFGAAFIWMQQERLAGGSREPARRLGSVWIVSETLGAVITTASMLMFVFPVRFQEHWPWTISPLLVRAFSAWFALIGLTLLLSTFLHRRASDTIIPFAVVATWSVLTLMLLLRYSTSLRTDAALFWILLTLQLASLALSGWVLVRNLRLMRTEGQQL